MWYSCKLELNSVERLFCNWYQDSQGLELWPPPVFMGVGDQRQEMLTDARHHATAGLTGRGVWGKVCADCRMDRFLIAREGGERGTGNIRVLFACVLGETGPFTLSLSLAVRVVQGTPISDLITTFPTSPAGIQIELFFLFLVQMSGWLVTYPLTVCAGMHTHTQRQTHRQQMVCCYNITPRREIICFILSNLSTK